MTRETSPSDDLLLELLTQNAHIKAHLDTLFMMQCELFAYLNKSEGKIVVEQWSDVREEFLKQNLDDLTERLRDLVSKK